MKYKDFYVSESNLLPFLSPTSPGTSWYDPPPDGVVNDRGIGRVILQFHQVAEILTNRSNPMSQMTFLDIGTGNGLLPDLVSKYLGAEVSVGLDPYEDGEHKTSWAKNTRQLIVDRVDEVLGDGPLTFSKYSHMLDFEQFHSVPRDVPFSRRRSEWKFEKTHLHQLETDTRFAFFFAKCVDHIHDWDTLFKAAARLSAPQATLVIKHNSFFSFNGAHRYASTLIPWGHVVLSDDNFRDYVDQVHGDRRDSMLEFFFDNLTYPRQTMDDLQLALSVAGWQTKRIEISIDKRINEKLELAGGAESLLQQARKNFPGVGLAELCSGRYLIVAEKAS